MLAVIIKTSVTITVLTILSIVLIVPVSIRWGQSKKEIRELDGRKYEKVEFVFNKWLWTGIPVYGFVIGGYAKVMGYSEGAFAGGCEDSVVLYYKWVDG